MNQKYAHIVAEVFEAVDAARRGEEHPRLNKMMERTRITRKRQATAQAAFFPARPRETINIASPHYHFTTEHYGAGGAVKAD